MKDNNKVFVVIKSIPIRYYEYYQWLLLGLYEMDSTGDIALSFKLPLYQRLFYNFFNEKTKKIAVRIKYGIAKITKYDILFFENYLLVCDITYKNQTNTVVYDIADSPYIFNNNFLKICNYYFKAQCPISIDSDGFRLTDDVFIPYHNDAIKYKNKIKPSMVGPRRLSWSIDYKSLKDCYNNYRKPAKNKKERLMMCYFGSAKGPDIVKIKNKSQDFNSEQYLISYYADQVNHPNEKRFILYKILKDMGDCCDARMINKTRVVDENKYTTKDTPIPLQEFTSHVAKFHYNLNVSGYRLSIPNRFIESFMVRTAIITDKLSVKWYKNFDEEVIELNEMGYLINSKIDWDNARKKLSDIQKNNPDRIAELYEQKWGPVNFAKYFITESLKNNE